MKIVYHADAIGSECAVLMIYCVIYDCDSRTDHDTNQDVDISPVGSKDLENPVLATIRPIRASELVSQKDWDQIYQEFAPLVRAKVLCRRSGNLDIEDAVQEAWLVLIARIDHYRPGGDPSDFLDWLTIVVRNRMANLERHAVRRRHASLDDVNLPAIVERGDSPAEAYERRRIRSSVHSALDEVQAHLPETSHRIMILKWIEGLTVSEIAEILELTPSQVRDRHRRAFPLLRSSLSRHFEPEQGTARGIS